MESIAKINRWVTIFRISLWASFGVIAISLVFFKNGTPNNIFGNLLNHLFFISLKVFPMSILLIGLLLIKKENGKKTKGYILVGLFIIFCLTAFFMLNMDSK